MKNADCRSVLTELMKCDKHTNMRSLPMIMVRKPRERTGLGLAEASMEPDKGGRSFMREIFNRSIGKLLGTGQNCLFNRVIER